MTTCTTAAADMHDTTREPLSRARGQTLHIMKPVEDINVYIHLSGRSLGSYANLRNRLDITSVYGLRIASGVIAYYVTP
jgi:uncharacterized membrane protein